MWPLSILISRLKGRPPKALQNSQQECSREVSARLQRLLTLSERCLEGCRLLREKNGLPEPPRLAETSSTSQPRQNSYSMPWLATGLANSK